MIMDFNEFILAEILIIILSFIIGVEIGEKL
jgi:hypothetical protein